MEIKSNGWFNIALTILFDDLSDYRLIKADVFKVVMIMTGDDNYDDVFKVSSKNPAASCAAVTEACTTELQLKWYTKVEGCPFSSKANQALLLLTLTNIDKNFYQD